MIAVLGRLLRWRVAAAVAFAGVAGHAAAANGGFFAPAAPVLFFSLFCLAGACSALNQAQEAAIDAQWPRTASRPLPSGDLAGKTALLAALGLALPALGGLALLRPCLAALGLGVIVLYNGVYTPLKKTGWPAFAAGAAVGAAPPLFGWLAAGKSPADPFLWALLFMLFAWQFPHVLLRAVDEGRMRPPMPDWPAERRARALLLGRAAYAASLGLLALAGHDFSPPARLGWIVLAALALPPFPAAASAAPGGAQAQGQSPPPVQSRRRRARDMLPVDGTMLMAMLIVLAG